MSPIASPSPSHSDFSEPDQVGPPCQLHVGEGLEQLLRTHAFHPLDRRVDGIRRLGRRLVVIGLR